MRCHTHSHLGLRRGPRAFYLVLTPCRYTQKTPPKLSTRADQDCFPCRSAQYSELSFQCAPLVLPGLNSPPTYRQLIVIPCSCILPSWNMLLRWLGRSRKKLRLMFGCGSRRIKKNT